MYDVFIIDRESGIPITIFSCHNYKLEQKLFTDSLVTFYGKFNKVMTEFYYSKFEINFDKSLYFYV